MHLGAEVVEGPVGVLAVEEHAGERRDAELAHLLAQEETALDLDRRLLARADHEAIGAGEARAVEQGVDRQAVGPGGGADQPELLEVGELLAPGLRRVDTEPARRQPEPLVLPDRPEVARAEEDDDLVVVVPRLDRIVDAEARIAELLRHPAGEVGLAVVELVGRELDRVRPLRLDDVHPHGPVVVQPRVEELDLEGHPPVTPERLLGAKADLSPLVVADLEQPVGHAPLRIPEGVLREPACPLGDVVETERRGARREHRDDQHRERIRRQQAARTPRRRRPRSLLGHAEMRSFHTGIEAVKCGALGPASASPGAGRLL